MWNFLTPTINFFLLVSASLIGAFTLVKTNVTIAWLILAIVIVTIGIQMYVNFKEGIKTYSE